MSGRTNARHTLRAAGWLPLGRTRELGGEGTETWYRWQGNTRHEIHVTFDGADRLYAWSLWQNVKHHHDQEPGLAKRLERVVEELAR